MLEYVKIFIEAILIKNLIFMKLFCIVPYSFFPKQIKTNIFLGIFCSFINVISAIFIWFIENYFIIPYHLTYLYIFINTIIIGFISQILSIILHKIHIQYFQILKHFFLLKISNIVVIFIPILNCNFSINIKNYIMYTFSNTVGFFFILTIISLIYKKITLLDIPNFLQGIPIFFITIGLISMGFLGLKTI